MKVLLLGAGGYIGSQFAAELKAREIHYQTWRATDYSTVTFQELIALLRMLIPQLVINACAFVPTNGVDDCEKDKAQNFQANLLFPTMLAHACEMTGVPLLHLSTGCMYQGDNGGNGWAESDPPQLTPNTGAGSYVSAKFMAEKEVAKYEKAYICRIRLPFDEIDHPRNLLSKLMRFPMVVDETQSLCHRGDVVKACLDLWQLRSDFGVYNVCSDGAVSYGAICNAINAHLYDGKREFKFITPAEFDSSLAKTKKSRCVLNVDKLKNAGVKIRRVEDAISNSLVNWRGK